MVLTKTKLNSLCQYFYCCYSRCVCRNKVMLRSWTEDRLMDNDVLKDWCSWKKWSFVQLPGGFSLAVHLFSASHFTLKPTPEDRASQWLNMKQFSVSHYQIRQSVTTTHKFMHRPGHCRLLYWTVLDWIRLFNKGSEELMKVLGWCVIGTTAWRKT